MNYPKLNLYTIYISSQLATLNTKNNLGNFDIKKINICFIFRSTLAENKRTFMGGSPGDVSEEPVK